MPLTNRPVHTERSTSKRRVRILVNVALFAGSVALLYVVLRFAAVRVTDWLWFREIGFERIFVARVTTQWLLRVGVAAVALVTLYVNIRFVKRRAVAPADKERSRRQLWEWIGPAAFVARFVDYFAVPIAVVAAIVLGLAAADYWIPVRLHFHRTPFAELDPVFGRDVSYYVFTLPVIEFLFEVVFVLLLATGALVIVLYAHRNDVVKRGWRLTVQPNAAVHVAALLAVLLVTVALYLQFVGIARLVYSTTGPLVGASYTDLHARLPALRFSVALALVVAVVVVWSARNPRFVRSATLATTTGGALFLLAVHVYPAIYQRIVVTPNELQREATQIEQHLRATKLAWGLNRAQLRELRPEQTLSHTDVEANAATIRNVNLWNRDLLLQTFGQLQSIRTYYDFTSADEDRYRIDGEYRQVHLAARELNSDLLPVRTFINERLTYTHGFGLALGPSNQATAEGLPVLFIRDLPPVSSTGLRVTRPEIYYGELTHEYVFVRTDTAAAANAAADGDGDAIYYGTGGVPVRSFLYRVLFALRFRSLNVLLSRQIDASSRALYHRNIDQRAQQVLPGIRLDGDPYLVVTDAGRLKWILDAYTVSRRYPYAESPLRDGTTYMRNSIKVVIDAYDGAVTAYLADPEDPLIRTWQAAFPGVLRPLDSLPRDVRTHLRYPEDLFLAQAALYGIYHMDEPAVFYHRENQWTVPAMPHQQRPDAYMQRMVMQLPGETAPEFVIMTPFSPRHKDNLASWMVGRSDEPHYGELVVYRFPRQSLIYGPRQIINRIRQDTEISRLVSLWDQRGSQVLWGDLLVIPLEQSLVYVQPLYLRAEGGQIPELKRIILAHQNQVVMEESLDNAIRRLFGADAGRPRGSDIADLTDTPVSPDVSAPAAAELIRRALQHYDAARAAQQADDWATYGNEIRALGEILRQLRGSTSAVR